MTHWIEWYYLEKEDDTSEVDILIGHKNLGNCFYKFL